MLDQRKRGERIDHRDLHELALAGAFTMKECSKHRIDKREPGDLVGNQRWHKCWRAGLQREGVRDPRVGLDHIVIRGTIRVGRIRWPTVRLTHHDVGPHRAHRVVGEAEAAERCGPKVSDEHIAGRRDPKKRIAARRVFQVEAHVAFIAQQVQRNARHPALRSGTHDAIGVTMRFLHRNDVGTEVAHDLRRVGAHHHR